MKNKKQQRDLWTPEQDKILLQGIQDNLTFDEIAKKVGRNGKSCSNRYYNMVKKGLTTVKRFKVVKNTTKPVKKTPRWTKEEDRTLCDQLRRHPECLEDGFTTASRILGRSISACRARWYQYASLDSNEEPVIVMGARNMSITNRRYFSRPSLIRKQNESWWKKVCCFFGFTKKQ